MSTIAGPTIAAWRTTRAVTRRSPRRMQNEFGLRFPLIHGDAERVPLAVACADLVISEYGASL